MKRIFTFLCFLSALFHITIASAGVDEAKAAKNNGDYAAALQEVRPLAQEGNAAAQNLLGIMYYEGQGIPQDYAQALLWYRKAADQGHRGAKTNIGTAYHNGEGVPQDYAKAAAWYRKAADQGYAAAQFYLGKMYEKGMGVRQDYAQAAVWYRKSADQGYAKAQTNLGNIENKFLAVTAKIGVPSVPGAIVCQDYDTVSLMMQLYKHSANENLVASIMGEERYRLMHGTPPSVPNVEKFGCFLVPPGTSMMWESDRLPAVVTVKLSNGKIFRGVTNPSMIKTGKE